MKIAVHNTSGVSDRSFCWGWISELEKRGVEVVKLDFRSPDVLSVVRKCDGAMWHWAHFPDSKQSAPKILDAMEFDMGIPVFPDFATRRTYDEKVAQHYLFQAIDAPRVPSWVFWNKDEALEFVGKCTYPIVFKLSVGAGSFNILKLDSRGQAEKMVHRMFGKGFQPNTVNEGARIIIPTSVQELMRLKSRCLIFLKHVLFKSASPEPWHYMLQKDYVYFQQFLPGNRHDIRVVVVGNRAWGFIRHNRPGDFRASGSGNYDMDPSNVPLEAVRIAHDVSATCGFQSMAYDFLYAPDGKLLINEISYCHGPRASECPGQWDRDLKWHEGLMRVEQAHVEDLLQRIAGS